MRMLLENSLSAGALIVWILILRKLAVYRLPKRVFVLLWDVTLLRLMVPIELPVGLNPVKTVLYRLEEQPEQTSPTVAASDAPMIGIDEETLWLMVWIAGLLIVMAVLEILYWQEYQRLREALPMEPEQASRLRSMLPVKGRYVTFLVSDQIQTPVTSGIFSARIVFPKGYHIEGKATEYILTHEIIHIRRWDNLRKLVVLAAVCVHWFNPLVWCMYAAVGRDMELACDEAVMAQTGEQARKSYAMTLLSMAERRSQTTILYHGFGRNAVQERIVAIMRYKKTTVLGITCAAMVLATSLTAFAAAAQDNEKLEITKSAATAEDCIEIEYDGSEAIHSEPIIVEYDDCGAIVVKYGDSEASNSEAIAEAEEDTASTSVSGPASEAILVEYDDIETTDSGSAKNATVQGK